MPSMPLPLRILMVGEDALESARIQGMLSAAGYEPAVVHVPHGDAFGAALRSGPWDVILGDASAKAQSVAATLALARTHAPDVPFVVLAGDGGDEDAIAWVRKGAADYVRKDGLDRLLAAVVREMREAESRRARLRASDDLLQTHARWSSLSRNAAYGMCLCAADGRFLLVNPALVTLLGCGSPEETLGLDPRRDVFRDPADLDRLLAAVGATGVVEGVEVDWMRRGGAFVSVRLTGHAVPSPTGADRPFECIVEDVTTRRSLERQLQVSQKMEAVGRLAGGIAHDFNNLLVAILGYSEMVANQLPEGGPLRRQVEQIHKAGERAASLTRQLLAFSRGQMLDRKPLDLNEVVASVLPMLRRLIGEDVAIVTSLDPVGVRVMADRSQVEQVLLNLVVNARDAMPRGGTVTIEVTSRVAPGTLPPSLAPDGSYAMVAVLDDGAGMTPDVQSHLFEPFFTTKPAGQGTGLGLSTLYGIVKQNLGDVSVSSEVGRGSQFRVFLPRTEEPIELSPPEPQGEGPRPPAATVLLVEDEPTVREIAREILQTGGYRVLEAKDGAEALRIAEEAREPFSLLLTDLVLPDTTGLELAERLRKRFPELKVLLTSGYTAQTLDIHGLTRSRVAFLPKPFRSVDLLRKVRAVLEAAAASPVA